MQLAWPWPARKRILKEVKRHLHGGLINQRRAGISPKKFLLPRMACPSTTVTLPNGDRIALRGGRLSVRVLVQLLTGRGYSVEVCLFPNNVLSSVSAADRPFLFLFRVTLLTVRKRAGPVASSHISELDKSSTSAFGHSNNDSDAVNPDCPKLGRNRC